MRFISPIPEREDFFFFLPDSPLICRAVLAETARVDQRGQSGVGDVGDGRGLGVTQEFGLVGHLR